MLISSVLSAAHFYVCRLRSMMDTFSSLVRFSPSCHLTEDKLIDNSWGESTYILTYMPMQYTRSHVEVS